MTMISIGHSVNGIFALGLVKVTPAPPAPPAHPHWLKIVR
jgi:hypothetical protein